MSNSADGEAEGETNRFYSTFGKYVNNYIHKYSRILYSPIVIGPEYCTYIHTVVSDYLIRTAQTMLLEWTGHDGLRYFKIVKYILVPIISLPVCLQLYSVCMCL